MHKLSNRGQKSSDYYKEAPKVISPKTSYNPLIFLHFTTSKFFQDLHPEIF